METIYLQRSKKLFICAKDKFTYEFIKSCLDIDGFDECDYVKIRHRYDIMTVVRGMRLGADDKVICFLDAATDNPDMLYMMNMTSVSEFSDRFGVYYFVPFLENQFGLPREFSNRMVTDEFKKFLRCSCRQLSKCEFIQKIQKFIDIVI